MWQDAKARAAHHFAASDGSQAHEQHFRPHLSPRVSRLSTPREVPVFRQPRHRQRRRPLLTARQAGPKLWPPCSGNDGFKLVLGKKHTLRPIRIFVCFESRIKKKCGAETKHTQTLVSEQGGSIFNIFQGTFHVFCFRNEIRIHVISEITASFSLGLFFRFFPGEQGPYKEGGPWGERPNHDNVGSSSLLCPGG